MNKKTLVRRIVARTGLSHDDVQAVLDTMADLVTERIALYESAVIPGLMKIGCTHKKSGGWQLHISPYNPLRKAVGCGVQR